MQFSMKLFAIRAKIAYLCIVFFMVLDFKVNAKGRCETPLSHFKTLYSYSKMPFSVWRVTLAPSGRAST